MPAPGETVSFELGMRDGTTLRITLAALVVAMAARVGFVELLKR